MNARKVILNVTAPAVSSAELARVIAYNVTGGDPAGYLERLAEKEAAEKAGEQTAAEGGE